MSNTETQIGSENTIGIDQASGGFTRADMIGSLRELYKEWCRMKAREERITSVRLPDYERMLDQIEKYGLKPTADICFQ